MFYQFPSLFQVNSTYPGLQCLVTSRINHEWLEFNQTVVWTLDFQKSSGRLVRAVIPYTLTWLAHLFAIQRRRWKYWKLSQEWVIIAAWVQAGPQSQNNSVGRNVLWKQTWTLSGTGRLFIPQIRPLLLQAAWHSNAPYFRNSLWINNTDSDKSCSYWSVSRCVCMLCVCVSVHVLYVCDKCYICDRAAWSSPWEAALFNDWTVFSSPYLPLFLTQCVSVCFRLTLFPVLILCSEVSSFVAPPPSFFCLGPGETLR